MSNVSNTKAPKTYVQMTQEEQREFEISQGFFFPSHFRNTFTGKWEKLDKPFVRHYPAFMQMEETDHLAVSSGVLDRYYAEEENPTIFQSELDPWGNKTEKHWVEILSGDENWEPVLFSEVDVVYLDYIMTRSKLVGPYIRRYANTIGKDRWEGAVHKTARMEQEVKRVYVGSSDRRTKKRESNGVGWMYVNLPTYMAYQQRRDSQAENSESAEFDTQDSYYEGATFLRTNDHLGYVDLDPSPWTTVFNSTLGRDVSHGKLKWEAENLFVLPSRYQLGFDWKPEYGIEHGISLIRECIAEMKKSKASSGLHKPKCRFEYVKAVDTPDKRAKTVFYHTVETVIGKIKADDPKLAVRRREWQLETKLAIAKTFGVLEQDEEGKLQIKSGVNIEHKKINGVNYFVVSSKEEKEKCVLPGRFGIHELVKPIHIQRITKEFVKELPMEDSIESFLRKKFKNIQIRMEAKVSKHTGETVIFVFREAILEDEMFWDKFEWYATLNIYSKLRSMLQGVFESGLEPYRVRLEDELNCKQTIQDAAKAFYTDMDRLVEGLPGQYKTPTKKSIDGLIQSVLDLKKAGEKVLHVILNPEPEVVELYRIGKSKKASSGIFAKEDFPGEYYASEEEIEKDRKKHASLVSIIKM